jgi:hypothetical protein
LVEIDVEIISTKISHDQKLLLILEEGGQAIVVCLKDGKEIPFGHAAAQEHIVTGDWHCDSKTLLLASRTGNLSIFRYSPKQHHFVFVHQFPIKSETDRHWIGSLNASLRVTFNHHGTSITTCYYANDRTCFLLLVLFDGQTLSRPTRIPFNHFHFGKVTCMATLDHRLTIVGTSTGKVLFKMKNQDKEEDFRSLRSLYHRIGEDAYDKRKKGDTPRELRDSGFSCIELREAGYKADELHALCALPPSTKNGDCDFTHLSDAQIICENKYGRITFVHPNDPADIRVVYQDGSTNTINTHDQCLATDYLERGSVRLLQWSSGGGSGKSSSGSSGGSNSIATQDIHHRRTLDRCRSSGRQLPPAWGACLLDGVADREGLRGHGAPEGGYALRHSRRCPRGRLDTHASEPPPGTVHRLPLLPLNQVPEHPVLPLGG